MPPKNVIDYAVGRLMVAFKDCQLFEPTVADLSVWIFTSSKHTQFGLTSEVRVAIKDAAARCNHWLDQYPLKVFEDRLKTIVADTREVTADNTVAASALREKLIDFFRRLDAPGEWEVVRGVFGVAAGEKEFTIGPCRFFVMGNEDFIRWRQRARCGRYDPPPGTEPLIDQTGLDQQLLDNWVATTRVRATDDAHAKAKAHFRLEETLNVLRHGTFRFGHPHDCPRAGLGQAHCWNDASVCMRVDGPGEFSWSSSGSAGVIIRLCGSVRAWQPLQSIIAKEPSGRTDLENTVMTALEWVGQAAAAPLAPVRLVSLVTALEILVLGQHQSRGKRRALAERVARIVSDVLPERSQVFQLGDRLYRVRSECLHDGQTQVEKEDVEAAFALVDGVIAAYMTKEPYCKCQSMAEALGLPEPEGVLNYQI